MKNFLDQTDPLPNLNPEGWFSYGYDGQEQYQLPESRRSKEEWAKACQKADGEDWVKDRDSTNPHVYINGKGQRKVVDPTYVDPLEGMTDIPIPCAVEYPTKEDLAADAAFWGQMEPRAIPSTFGEAGVQAALDKLDGWNKHEEPPYTIHGKTVTEEQFNQWARTGWIPHTPGDPMPCDPKQQVYRKWRNGTQPGKSEADELHWGTQESEGYLKYEIIAWKPA